MRLTILGLISSLTFACGPTSSGDVDSGGNNNGTVDSGPSNMWPDARVNFTDAGPAEACGKMDIVFVIDNSGSMGQEQDNLATNFPLFINVLDNFDNELDYRVGVTTTGKDYNYTMTLPGIGSIPASTSGGDNGELLQRCDMTRRWVEPGDPNVADTFACAAQVGTSGPADEMPLASLKLALDDRIADGTNAGFLRDDALLAIVILTDEDDCSYEQSVSLGFTESLCSSQMEPVSSYSDFLTNLTGDAGRWAVATIAGPTDCSSEFGNAAEATRLKDFTNIAGANGVFSSICDGDLAAALQTALETFDTACNDFPPID